MYDYYKQYIEYLEYLKTDEYNKYIIAIKKYYSLNTICNKCKTVTIKKSENKKLIINCSNCTWSMTIEQPIYVNLFNDMQTYDKKKQLIVMNIKLILTNDDITPETKTRFNKLKQQYNKTIKYNNNITKLITYQTNNIALLKHDELTLHKELFELYSERQTSYIQLIDISAKNKIINYYKINPSPSKLNLDKLIKDTTLPETDVKKYIKWLDKCKEYCIKQVALNNLAQQIIELTKLYDKANREFMIKRPIIIETSTKKISLDKSTITKQIKRDKKIGIKKGGAFHVSTNKEDIKSIYITIPVRKANDRNRFFIIKNKLIK